jgi:hypothetical protein
MQKNEILDLFVGVTKMVSLARSTGKLPGTIERKEIDE